MANEGNSGLTLALEKDSTIKADWSSFIANTAEAITNFFIKGPADGISGAISTLVKLVTSVEVSASPGQRAWVLVASSFGWALDQVVPDECRHRDDFKNALRHALDQASYKLDAGYLEVPLNYLERPTNIEIYQILLNEFCNYIEERNPGTFSDLKWRISSAYSRGVFEIWSRKPEYYVSLLETLKTGPSSAAEFEINWRAYRSQLISDFEIKPVFGQEDSKVPLSKLYVPLRCSWFIEEHKRDRNTNPEIDYYNESANIEIASIHDELLRWVESNDNSDWLRIIGGGPGSGKSTTLKAFSRELAAREELRPLLIPLQHIDLKKDLRESINHYFTDTSGSAFSHPPLARSAVEDGPPLVLLFDGLDEIAAPGEAAKDVVGDFANRLNSLIATLNGSANNNVRVVVSGRMPAFQAARRYLTPPAHGALEVLGFLPVKDGDLKGELWNLDQRPQWWRQFAQVKGLPVETPAAFSTERLAGITHEPLLCYLLALADYATEHWEEAADNRNRIYSALVNSIYDRGWGEGVIKRQGAGKTLTRHDFNQLMETIALAAWLGGDSRVASEAMFEQAINITGAQRAWKAFTEDNGDDVTNLAMNFYLKSSEKEERGFEFTHKSFGEYLAARSLVAISADVAEYYAKKPDHALDDWYRSTKSGEFDSEILGFCIDEARLTAAEVGGLERLKSIKAAFQEIAYHASLEGFPLKGDGSTWKKIEGEQISAECGVWVILNSCSRAIAEYGALNDAYIDIQWDDSDSLSKIMRRFSINSLGRAFFLCLSYVIARNHEFSDFVSGEINIDGAILDGSLFARVVIRGGSFKGCSLQGVRFYESKIFSGDFHGAVLENVIFHKSAIRGCSFEGVDAQEIVFSPASYLLMSDHQLSKLRLVPSVLVSRPGSLTDVVEFLNRRIASLENLGEHDIENLIEDWPVGGSDFESHPG